ncbi:murein biosynthesis integral membrane protein MurJ [Neobacillus drentensis]|uniref:murein biosynthesis integral membrane protein MurJ n=1 Tax=Neobacillus drentensis TaxID=220684 RepID=UPI002FFD5EA9
MKKTVIFLMFITMFTKILGFLRDIILSYYYGTSQISDAYLIADSIPIIIISLIGTGLATSYIPMYTKIEKHESVLASDRFTNNIIGFVILMCSIILLLSQLFTVEIVKIFASGFRGETLKLAVQFTKISIFGIYFSCLVYIFSGYLQLKERFVATSLLGLPYNIVVIGSVVLGAGINKVVILPIGGIFAEAFKFLFLLPYIIKSGFKYQMVLDFKDKHLKNLMFLALPVIIGVSVNQINLIVDKTIASRIVTGGISALTYSSRISQLIQSVFVITIATVVFPRMSKAAAERNGDYLKILITKSFCWIHLIVIPASVISILFSEPIVKILFGRGAFDHNALLLTSSTLLFYSIGNTAMGLREILSRAFYSLQDTKTPMINATIALLFNIILNLILTEFMNLAGIALATSIAAIIGAFLLFINIQKKVGKFSPKEIYPSFLKISISSIIMGVVSKFIFKILLNQVGLSFSLIISFALGILIYSILIYFMKINEVELVLQMAKNKIIHFNKEKGVES